MTSPSSDSVPNDPRQPATAASSGAIPKKCPTCGTFYSNELCPKCVVGFAGQPTGQSTPQITPYGETVRLDHGTDRRQKTEPAIPEEALAAPPTAKFGKFIRTLRLGAGGMGEVWKAWDSMLGRWVALKFLKGGDDDEIARFRREAQTAGRLHHPNIAAIYEVNEDQGRQYIAMQYVDGQNLHQFTRDDRALLVRLVASAARALHYAHEQGVIHRDLKPENLMVTARGTDHHVFLMDFGLARATEGASKISATGFLVGTPMYMSPEQARGDKVDVRSDVYSLGLTLYELLTDRKPFESESVYETLRRVQETDPPPVRLVDRRISEDLETVVMKAISKDPASRYPTAQAFAEDLDATLRGEAIQGRRESLSRKLIRRVRRHPFAFATGAVLAIGLTVIGSIAIGASRDRRVTELTTRIEEGLRVREWTDAHLSSVEDQIAALAKVDPSQAAARKARLPQAIADAIRGADLALARKQLPVLERVDPDGAKRLDGELRQRESIWPGVFTLEAPFVAAPSVFGPGRVQVAGDLLRCAESGPVRTRTACEGNVQLKVEFDSAWKESTQLGLMLNLTNQSGYHFLLLTTSDGTAAPSFAAVHAEQGLFRVQIRRGELVVRDARLPSEKISINAPLRIMARRQGDKLSFQVNDLELVEFRDPFALGVGQKGVFGVTWPPGVGVRRLLATHEKLAVNPSLLNLADDLFLQGKFEEALDRYGEAAQSAAAGEVREEALYKQGLCNLQLNREEAAKRIFESVAAGFLAAKKRADTRWYFLSDCQLLVLYFREKDGIEQATAILNKLGEYQYTFDQLAILLPPDVQRQILQGSQIGSIGSNFHRRPEEHVARTEFDVLASEILESPTRWWGYKYHHLMRAYMMAGRPADALRIAEKSFRTFKYGGEALDDYCWIRRLSGDEKEIRAALAAIDRGLATDPTHLVERARIHLALNDVESAAKDLDAFLAKPSDYHFWAAACLLRGFVYEQQGAPAKAEEAWRRGLLKNWQAPKDAKPSDLPDFYKIAVGMPMLHYWIMASLVDEMTDAEAEHLLSGLTSFAGKDNPVFNKLMRPSVLRGAWRTARAREVARHVAVRDVTFTDVARWPLFIGWIRFVHEVCFNAAEPLSPDQDELLWRMSEEIYVAYREGTLTDRYFLPFGAIVAGNPNAPGMGWREVAILLEKQPKLRGPLAYIFGQRYVKKGDTKMALMFYKAAASDADRDPAYPLLQRLAKTEIDALTPK